MSRTDVQNGTPWRPRERELHYDRVDPQRKGPPAAAHATAGVR